MIMREPTCHVSLGGVSFVERSLIRLSCAIGLPTGLPAGKERSAEPDAGAINRGWSNMGFSIQELKGWAVLIMSLTFFVLICAAAAVMQPVRWSERRKLNAG